LRQGRAVVLALALLASRVVLTLIHICGSKILCGHRLSEILVKVLIFIVILIVVFIFLVINVLLDHFVFLYCLTLSSRSPYIQTSLGTIVEGDFYFI
jgi:hypothetical protein